MAFSQDTKDEAYRLAGGKCERCGQPCRRISTDYGYSYPDSEFHHKLSVEAGGSDALSNCEHLCISCHENTKSYGRH